MVEKVLLLLNCLRISLSSNNNNNYSFGEKYKMNQISDLVATEFRTFFGMEFHELFQVHSSNYYYQLFISYLFCRLPKKTSINNQNQRESIILGTKPTKLLIKLCCC